MFIRRSENIRIRFVDTFVTVPAKLLLTLFVSGRENGMFQFPASKPFSIHCMHTVLIVIRYEVVFFFFSIKFDYPINTFLLMSIIIIFFLLFTHFGKSDCCTLNTIDHFCSKVNTLIATYTTCFRHSLHRRVKVKLFQQSWNIFRAIFTNVLVIFCSIIRCFRTKRDRPTKFNIFQVSRLPSKVTSSTHFTDLSV